MYSLGAKNQNGLFVSAATEKKEGFAGKEV
jgi:hypothetical protein